jgi:hypothetical protein
MAEKERSSMVNLPLYLYSLYISFFLFALSVIATLRHDDVPAALTMAGSLGLVGVSIYLFVILYRLWAFVIERAQKSGLTPSIASPGQAVGRLLVPVYQFYWLFVCLRGLTRDLNALAAERGLAARLSMKFATTTSALCVIGWVPGVNFVVVPITSLILYPVFIYQTTTFARNLRVLEETGQNLFAAHGQARAEMLALRGWGGIFPATRLDLSTVRTVVLLVLLWFGLGIVPSFFIQLLGLTATMVMPVLLAALLFPITYHSRSAILAVGGWAVLFGLMGYNESFMMAMYYGDLRQLRGLYQVSFVCGALFIAALWLGIRVWGVRWWGIFLAYAVSFISYVIISKTLFSFAPYFFGQTMLHMLLSFGLMTAVLYLGIYLKVKRRIENNW